MTLGLMFWILMLIWFVFSAWQAWPAADFKSFGGTLLMFVLFLLLGWHSFGPPVKG